MIRVIFVKTINIIFSEKIDNELKREGERVGVIYIDVDTVFDHYKETDGGRKMINRMIGFKVN